jgi:hypothetical protein
MRDKGGGLTPVVAGGRGSGGWTTQRHRVCVAQRATEPGFLFLTSRVVDGSPGEARGKVRVNSARGQPNGELGLPGVIWAVDCSAREKKGKPSGIDGTKQALIMEG